MNNENKNMNNENKNENVNNEDRANYLNDFKSTPISDTNSLFLDNKCKIGIIDEVKQDYFIENDFFEKLKPQENSFGVLQSHKNLQLDPIMDPIFIYSSDFIDIYEYNSGKTWKGEEDTREIFESLFHPAKFKTVRLDILKNPYTKRALEIDGLFAIEIKTNGVVTGYIFIGFEHQGIHHREYPNSWHKSNEDFEKQIMRDKWKFDKCKRLGFIIIEVYFDVENKREYIINELGKYPILSKHYKI